MGIRVKDMKLLRCRKRWVGATRGERLVGWREGGRTEEYGFFCRND